jgi:hypothetical protein
MPHIWQTVLRASLSLAFYGAFLWRMTKKYRGDKFIAFGNLTVMSLVLVLVLGKLPFIPDWLLSSLELLTYLLCLLTLGFLFQQAYQAIRMKIAKHHTVDKPD